MSHHVPHHLTTTRTHALLSLLAFDGFALSRQREKVRRKEIKTRSAEHSVRWVTLGTAGSIPHRQFMLQYKRLMSACPSVRSIEGEVSFAYAMNEMDRYSSWMEEGRKLCEKRREGGGRKRETYNTSPRPAAGLLLHLQTHSPILMGKRSQWQHCQAGIITHVTWTINTYVFPARQKHAWHLKEFTIAILILFLVQCRCYHKPWFSVTAWASR